MNVLIAEDEPMEARALQKLLEQYYPNHVSSIELVATGQAAVEAARRSHPDLVFMDINMPELDGVSASRAIRSFDETVEIIMLTAYADFDYAKQSISNRVLDYIVKPYSVRTLRAAMDSAVEQIGERVRSRREVEASRNLVTLLQREFLHKIIVNFRLREEIIRRYAQMIGIYDQCYRIILFQPGGEQDADAPVWNEVIDCVQRLGIACMHTRFSQTVCIIPYAPRPAELAGPLDRALAVLHKRFPGARLQAGPVQTRWEDIALQFYQALTSLINPEANETAIVPEVELEERLSEAVISRDRERSDEICRELIDVLYRQYGTSNDFGYSLIAAYRGVLRSVHALEQKNPGDSARNFAVNFRVPYRGDRELALIDLTSAIERIIAWLDESVRGKTGRVVQLVKKYIDAHYGENISLEALARHASISKFYLSRMFKSCENETIISYLQRVRIDNAKRMLKAGRSPSEACYQCGFSDPAYFGKSFKKATGTTPAQFAKRYGSAQSWPDHE